MDRGKLYNTPRDKQVYFFDIDGTITVETEGWDYLKRTPRLEVIDKINTLYDSGVVHVVFWTSRLSIDRKATEFWMDVHAVKYHELKFGKPFFDLYICDKAINIEQWEK